jgi:twitching motility protein PilT
VLLSIPAVSNLIREGKTFQIPSIMQTNRKLGMVTLNDALLELVAGGTVEPKEAYLKSAEKTGLLTSFKAKGINTSFLGDG